MNFVIFTRQMLRETSARLRFLRALLICFLLGGMAAPISAHDPGLSTAQAELRADALHLTNGFAPADARQLLPRPEGSSASLTAAEFETEKAEWLALAPQLWEVRNGNALLTPRDIRVEFLPGDNVSFHLSFPLSTAADKLTLRATRLDDLPHGHRQFVTLTDDRGSAIAQRLLSASNPSLEISRSVAAQPVNATAVNPSPGFWGFLRLGVEHIWTGYDHLLFLFGLLIVCRTFRSIVAILSCFTVAHSLTLALATLQLVNLSPRLVEPAIAASIIFVGVENLWREGEHSRSRLALTFAFGLIHGFGFANVLRNLGVGSGGRDLAMPLLSFNLGVELGQIVLAAVVLPGLWQLRKNRTFVRRGVPIISGVIAAAGLFWFCERTFF